MPEVAVQPALAQALRDAVAEVLEKMFFIRILENPRPAAEISAPGEGSSPESEILTQVTFHGEPPGKLSLRLERRVARAIAADFLGEEEPELEEREVEDVTRELANMVCGTVLTHVESAVLFGLDEPQLADASAPECGRPESAMHVFPIGAGVLKVKIWMEEPACGAGQKYES
jgi:CheY-specific phosphatase CheX